MRRALYTRINQLSKIMSSTLVNLQRQSRTEIYLGTCKGMRVEISVPTQAQRNLQPYADNNLGESESGS